MISEEFISRMKPDDWVEINNLFYKAYSDEKFDKTYKELKRRFYSYEDPPIAASDFIGICYKFWLGGIEDPEQILALVEL